MLSTENLSKINADIAERMTPETWGGVDMSGVARLISRHSWVASLFCMSEQTQITAESESLSMDED